MPEHPIPMPIFWKWVQGASKPAAFGVFKRRSAGYIK
jgi:hypothetical protein